MRQKKIRRGIGNDGAGMALLFYIGWSRRLLRKIICKQSMEGRESLDIWGKSEQQLVGGPARRPGDQILRGQVGRGLGMRGEL